MINEYEKHPQLASYITEMKDSGQIPADFDKFLSCLNESLKPKTKPKLPISERKAIFIETLRVHLDVYGRDMLNDFSAYWVEINKSNTSMRFESERFWDLARRLKTWANRNKLTKREIIEKEKPVVGRMTGDAIKNSLNNFQ